MHIYTYVYIYIYVHKCTYYTYPIMSNETSKGCICIRAMSGGMAHSKEPQFFSKGTPCPVKKDPGSYICAQSIGSRFDQLKKPYIHVKRTLYYVK